MCLGITRNAWYGTDAQVALKRALPSASVLYLAVCQPFDSPKCSSHYAFV
jgi:hypothetical protein